MSFFERMKVAVRDDPLSNSNWNNNNNNNRVGHTDSFSSSSASNSASPRNSVSNRSSDASRVKTESLTIRLTDELRIVGAMADAAKKKTSGVIFTVRVDTSKSASLCIGVKDLQDKLLAVSMLKRVNGVPGPVEQAGVRLGDIIFGVNFQPCREGSRTLLQTVKREKERKRHTIHLQCWRCKQLCSDSAPGALFPRVDEMLVQAYAMFRTKVFSDWERWNFVEILLDHMVEDLKTRTSVVVSAETLATNSHQLRVQNQILDLEHNILQAKGLRTALCVRVVHTRIQADTVIYVLRVEDVETGLQWVVHRRYRDFAALNEELSDMSHFTKDISFPRKHLTSSKNSRIVEERIIALEQFVRRVLHVLTLYATMDPLASRSLRHLQNFLGVDRYIDCIHPPLVDDQRCIELMAYRILSDFSSPACQQCIRFVAAVDLDSLVRDGPDGYKPMLKHLALALAEVEAFVLENHLPQMLQSIESRKPDYTAEQCRVFVRRCVRRQVEAAIFLPLRRNVFRIVYSFVAVQAQCMQRAMGLLQQAAPDYFEVDSFILQTKAMPRAIKSFRDVIQAYLPADQGQLLMHAAAAVMQLHSECSVAMQQGKNKKKAAAVAEATAAAVTSDRLSGGGGGGNMDVNTSPAVSMQRTSATAAAANTNLASMQERLSRNSGSNSSSSSSRLSGGGADAGSVRSKDHFFPDDTDIVDPDIATPLYSVSANLRPAAAGMNAASPGSHILAGTSSTKNKNSGKGTSNGTGDKDNKRQESIHSTTSATSDFQQHGSAFNPHPVHQQQQQHQQQHQHQQQQQHQQQIDYTCKATMADPVGTIFHSHETRPDAVLLSRRKSIENNHGDGLSQQQSRSPVGLLQSPAGGDNSSRITGTHVESSFSPSAGAFMPSLSGHTASSASVSSNSDINHESSSSYSNGKSHRRNLSVSTGGNIGIDDADVDAKDEDEDDAADTVSAALNSLEAAENSRRTAKLQDKLRELALVPTTPLPAASRAAGCSGNNGGDADSRIASSSNDMPTDGAAGVAATVGGGGGDSGVQPRSELFPDDDDDVDDDVAEANSATNSSCNSGETVASVAVAVAGTKGKPPPVPPARPTGNATVAAIATVAAAVMVGGDGISDESLSAPPLSPPVSTAAAVSSSSSSAAATANYQYFTSEERQLLEEVMGDREYITEEQTEAAVAAAAQAINVGKTQDKFGASDAKMVATTTTDFFEESKAMQQEVVSADDFLPMFTFVLVQASLPQLLLVKEIMTALVADEETYGECGYYLATLEAATQHIVTLAEQFEDIDKADQLFNGEMLTPGEGDGGELY